jgi:hypothetical protein
MMAENPIIQRKGTGTLRRHTTAINKHSKGTL